MCARPLTLDLPGSLPPSSPTLLPPPARPPPRPSLALPLLPLPTRRANISLSSYVSKVKKNIKVKTRPPPRPAPRSSNLSMTVLTMKAMGINDLLNFDFMDPPPAQVGLGPSFRGVSVPFRSIFVSVLFCSVLCCCCCRLLHLFPRWACARAQSIPPTQVGGPGP